MLFNTILGALTFVVSVVASPVERASRPVCVVGAGPAGLTVASNLEKKGKQVVIFEEKSVVGGKCQAVYERRNNYFPLGALLFSNGSYPETLKVINKVGVPAVPLVVGDRWLFNWTSGIAVPPANVPVEFATLVGQEYQLYAQYWTTVFAPYSALRYKNGVPAEFAVTTAEWLEKNNFRALPVLFVQAMVSFGYGDLQQTPILYMLQYLTPDLLGFFANIHGVYLIDFHEVFVRFAKQSVKSRIVLNSNIRKIDRAGNFPTIEYTTGMTKRDTSFPAVKQACSSIVLAFPPTIKALSNANLKLSADEKTVFGPVGITDYWSGSTRLNTPQDLTFAAASVAPNVPVKPEGQPVYWLKLWKNSNIATSWSWGPYRGGVTTSKAYQLLIETFSKFNKDSRDITATTKRVGPKDVLALQQNDYFPRFDAEQLKNGWYEKYNALQGKQNTFYTSGLNGFETVEFAIRGANDLVESFF